MDAKEAAKRIASRLVDPWQEDLRTKEEVFPLIIIPATILRMRAEPIIVAVQHEMIEKCVKIANKSCTCSSDWLAKWKKQQEKVLTDEEIRVFSHADWIAEQIRALAMKEE